MRSFDEFSLLTSLFDFFFLESLASKMRNADSDSDSVHVHDPFLSFEMLYYIVTAGTNNTFH